MAAASGGRGAARWLAESHCGVVTKAVGKYLNTMGYRDAGQKLFAEEVVFLVDCGELDLYSSLENLEKAHAMTKIEVFALLESANIDMKAYTVYAVLREQRFHVYRHGASDTPVNDWKRLAPPRLAVTGESSGVNVDVQSKRMRLDDGSQLPVSIAFDVYRPQSNFGKNKMGKPDFSVAIISADEMMPSISRLLAAVRTLPENVPLRLGVVGDSSITFVDVTEFDVSSAPPIEDSEGGVKSDGSAAAAAN